MNFKVLSKIFRDNEFEQRDRECSLWKIYNILISCGYSDLSGTPCIKKLSFACVKCNSKKKKKKNKNKKKKIVLM